MGLFEEFVVSGPKAESYYPPISVGKIFFEALKKRNKDEAILFDGETGEKLTYGDILKQTIQCARFFEKLDIKQGDVVSSSLENNHRVCVLIIACWYIGAVYHPWNPSYTISEVIHSAKLSKPKLVFCCESTLDNCLSVKQSLPSIENLILLEGKSLEIKSFDDILFSENSNSDDFSPVDLEIETQPALILNSSGTTGLSKGVMLTHSNVIFELNYMKDPNYMDCTSKDTTINPLPYHHIFGYLILSNAIICGMKLVTMKKFKPELYLQLIQEYKATKLFLVPTLATFLAKSPLVDDYDISSVNDIICGGAPLHKDIQEYLTQRLKNADVRQLFGMTELSGCMTVVPKKCKGKLGSSGILVPYTKAKVVDTKTREKLGSNRAGEICFKGPGNMQCYVGNVSATQESFDEEGYLRSGDVGYYDEDNHFYVIDRVKDLIKFKGFQVPPAELEAILLKHASVREVCVIGKPDDKAGELPIAFVVKQNENDDVKEEDIVNFVDNQVSIQKRLRGGVRFVNGLPKNPTGKILRKELRELLAGEYSS